MSILKLENIIKYYGDHQVLKGVSLSLQESEVVVILGPSGCGKSTLLRCINALESIQGGRIYIDKEEIKPGFKHWDKIREKIGMVFQSYELFDHLNVCDNILLAPLKVQNRDKKEVLKQAISLLERVGLEKKLYAMPKELSGGQKQRIAIVRSLCTNPKLMLFDEVTAALDPEIVREVLDVILNLAKDGMSMIIVTHELAFARAVADRIVFMDEGQIVEQASPADFFKSPKTKRAKKFLNLFSFN